MDTTDMDGASLHDWMVIQDVKALTEKLHLLMQDRSTPKTYQPVHAESEHPAAADVTSDSSGCSMSTPSSTIGSEHDEDESQLEQRDPVREMMDDQGVIHGLRVEHSDIDRCNGRDCPRPNESEMALEQPHKDNDNVQLAESPPANQLLKTPGFVTSLEEGIGAQQGQEIVRFFSDDQHLSFELRSGKLSSIANGGEDSQHLSAVRSESRERDTCGVDSSAGGGDLGTHLCRTNKRCNNQYPEETRLGIKATGKPSMLLHQAALVDSTDVVAMPLDGPSTIFGHVGCQKSVQDASNDTLSTSRPTDFVKADTSNTNENNFTCNPVMQEQMITIETTQKISDTPTQLLATCEVPKLRRAIRLNSGDMFVVSWFGLCFLVIVLIRCIVVMSAETRGHCVGIWLGS